MSDATSIPPVQGCAVLKTGYHSFRSLQNSLNSWHRLVDIVRLRRRAANLQRLVVNTVRQVGVTGAGSGTGPVPGLGQNVRGRLASGGIRLTDSQPLASLSLTARSRTDGSIPHAP